jgi:hypothetical protein
MTEAWEGGELLFAGGTDFFAVRDTHLLIFLNKATDALRLLHASHERYRRSEVLQVGRHATLRTKKKSEKEEEVRRAARPGISEC